MQSTAVVVGASGNEFSEVHYGVVGQRVVQLFRSCRAEKDRPLGTE